MIANPVGGKLDFDHFKAVHEGLFQDVYDWAGQTRAVEISKGHSAFAPAQHIDSHAQKVFGDLAAENHLGEINALHPFRDGNGGARRAFMDQIAERGRTCRLRLRLVEDKPARNDRCKYSQLQYRSVKNARAARKDLDRTVINPAIKHIAYAAKAILGCLKYFCARAGDFRKVFLCERAFFSNGWCLWPAALKAHPPSDRHSDIRPDSVPVSRPAEKNLDRRLVVFIRQPGFDGSGMMRR